MFSLFDYVIFPSAELIATIKNIPRIMTIIKTINQIVSDTTLCTADPFI